MNALSTETAGEVASAWPKLHAGAAAPDAPPAEAAPARPTTSADDDLVWLERGRIPCLDGLRALSIGLVFVEHIYTTTLTVRPVGFLRMVANVGVLGVDVFFTISGFLITLLLVREWERTGGVSLKGFYTRRFLRLMPAMAAFLLTLFVLQALGQVRASGHNWVHMLTYTVNFDPAAHTGGHLWSLSIEEQFYLVWPVAILALGPRGGKVAAVAWLLAAPLVRFIVFRFHPHDMGRYDNWTFFRVDTIAAGCLLGLLARDPKFRRFTRTSPATAAALIALAAVVMFAGYAIGFRVALYQVTLGHSVRALCIAAMIWLTVTHSGSAWGRLLDTKLLVTVGVLSYSLYLWQQPFMTDEPDLQRFGIGVRVCGVIAAAIASYLLIEQPFLRLKDRLGR